MVGYAATVGTGAEIADERAYAVLCESPIGRPQPEMHRANFLGGRIRSSSSSPSSDSSERRKLNELEKRMRASPHARLRGRRGNNESFIWNATVFLVLLPQAVSGAEPSERRFGGSTEKERR